MIRNIPNAISCLNLFCGCLSIVWAFSGRLDLAACWILAAAVFDFFDGFVARMLKAYSDLGKQLDSLADVVSFGVAPASIMYNLLLASISQYEWAYPVGWLIAFSAYLIAVFSALRLAKFNIDTRQSDSFIGLPTPANAIFICSLAFISRDIYINIFFLLAATIVFSYLLVAELPFFSLKFKSFDWKSNRIRYILGAVSALTLSFFQLKGLSIVILLYILLSVISNIKLRRRKNR